MDNFDEYLKLRSTVEPPVDTDDTVMFDIVNRTIMPNHITDIIVKNDNLSRNIKYRIQRYFEGVDLYSKSISFRYNTPNSETDESFAKNVIVDDCLITFEWQVSNKVTYKSGIVEYDIMFYDNGGYCWHTKPATIKVETGLEYHTLTPKPSYDWLDSWRAEAGNILVQCREAESKAIQVEGNISVAIDAATRATDAAIKITSDLGKTLTKDNVAPYTPTDDYHPATKKYIDEKAISVGTGDMLTSIYDKDNDGIVDNVPWNGITNKPTTVAGYNITDAATKSEIPTTLSQLTNDSDFVSNDRVEILQTEVAANTISRHAHSNKGVLDRITSILIDSWNSAFTHITDVVTHITAAERDLWNTVSNKADISEVNAQNAEIGTSMATEIGQLILANTRAYPHSNAIGTVALVLPRLSMDYLVSIEVLVTSGSIEGVEVYDKQLNGFKIRYSGSAASATIKYYVSGGMKQ